MSCIISYIYKCNDSYNGQRCYRELYQFGQRECEKESLSNGCLETEFEKLEVGDSQPWNYKEHSYDENLEHNICPECGSSLGRGEGCPKCINCGFSKC